MRTEQGWEGCRPGPRTPGPPGAGRGREDPTQGLGREHGPGNTLISELWAPELAECCKPPVWSFFMAAPGRSPGRGSPYALNRSMTSPPQAWRPQALSEGTRDGWMDDVGFDEKLRQESCRPQVPHGPHPGGSPCIPAWHTGPPALTQGSGGMCLSPSEHHGAWSSSRHPRIEVWGSGKLSQLSGRETGVQI